MISSKRVSCLAWILLLGLLVPPAVVAQYVHHGGVETRQDRSRFSFFLGAGPSLVDDFDHGSLVLELEPRFELKKDDRNLFEWTLPLLWWPGSRLLPGGEDAAFPGLVRSGELQVGSSLAVVPSFEWSPRTLRCCSYSFFVGAGVHIERGRQSWLTVAARDGDIEVPLEVTVETLDTFDPMVVLGASWARAVGKSSELRVKARLFTTFYDERTAKTDLGDRVLPSEAQSGALITVGFRLRP